MTKFYYTLDNDGDTLTPEAPIWAIEAETEEAFKVALLRIANAQYDQESLIENNETLEAIDTMSWGDCWHKASKDGLDIALEYGLDGLDPDLLYVNHPGTHPGGNVYWINPLPTIWTVICKQKN